MSENPFNSKDLQNLIDLRNSIKKAQEMKVSELKGLKKVKNKLLNISSNQNKPNYWEKGVSGYYEFINSSPLQGFSSGELIITDEVTQIDNSVPQNKIEEFSTKPNPPDNCRFLKTGEKIKKGDRYYNAYHSIDGGNAWIELSKGDINSVYVENAWPLTCRKERPPVVYDDITRNNILNFLKDKRAFNGDSAFKLDGQDGDICADLSEKGIIKCVDEDRFYIEK